MPNSHVYGKRTGQIGFWTACLAVALFVATVATAQDTNAPPALGDLLGVSAAADSGESLAVKAVFTVSQPNASGAQIARLFVTADISAGYYIYSITQGPGGPIATTITPTESKDYKLTSPFVTDAVPHKEKVEVFGNIVVETHKGKITWQAPLEIAAGVDPGKLQIKGSLRAQVCNGGCLLKSYTFTATFAEKGPVPVVAGPPAAAATQTATAPPTITGPPPVGGTDNQVKVLSKPPTSDTPGASVFTPGELKIAANEEIAKTSTIMILVMAFAGGLILNIMPCVLPVIGLKLLSFIEQSGESRSRVFMLNFWYSLGLLSVFMVLATLAVAAGVGWGMLFKYSGFTITLTAIVFVMALSFFGVWEIPIPGFAGRGKANELAQREGPGGAFAKGILTTFLATPCSAPLLAPALAWATTRSPGEVYMVFFCVGLGMASPYLLIGAFPALIRFLPKPGEWMETFKHIMGFVLLATVVYLLTTLHPSHVVPAIALMFGLWGACWWIGSMPYTADGHTKIRRWLQSTIFVAIIVIIAYPGIDEFAPEQINIGSQDIPLSFGGIHDVMSYRLEKLVNKRLAEVGSEPVKVTSEDEIIWIPFTIQGLSKRLAERQTVLVDFTADWCTTCKTLEATVLDTRSMREKLVKHNIATMQADMTHEDPELKNFQRNLGSEQVPVIAIFPADRPNEPVVLLGGYTSSRLTAAIEEAVGVKDQ